VARRIIGGLATESCSLLIATCSLEWLHSITGGLFRSHRIDSTQRRSHNRPSRATCRQHHVTLVTDPGKSLERAWREISVSQWRGHTVQLAVI